MYLRNTDRKRRRKRTINKKERIRVKRIVTVWWYLQQVLSGCSTWKHLIWKHCGRDSDYHEDRIGTFSRPILVSSYFSRRRTPTRPKRPTNNKNSLGAKGTPLMNTFRGWQVKILTHYSSDFIIWIVLFRNRASNLFWQVNIRLGNCNWVKLIAVN